jgi:hypothetical protein
LVPSQTEKEGGIVEEIYQVRLDLEPEMLRQLSLLCFNDLRTVFLVHDKRLFGIVNGELEPLVAKRVIIPVQTITLDLSIKRRFSLDRQVSRTFCRF